MSYKCLRCNKTLRRIRRNRYQKLFFLKKLKCDRCYQIHMVIYKMLFKYF